MTIDLEKQRLQRAWTQELYREYDQILFSYRVRLAPPLILIAELGSVWGKWHPLTRTITISSLLIERYAWDVVIEVLKHEMAHQLVSERMGGDHTHGAAFQRACSTFGVAPWAARATGDLPEEIHTWKDRALSPEDERLLRRAEKLLALATSANENEALLAMQRVRELYERHNLDRLAARRGAKMVHLLIGRGKKKLDAAETMIASILVEHFFVKAIFTDTYDPSTCERSKVVEVMGAEENVLMAEYVHHFLYRQAHALWEEYRRRTGKSVGSKRSYVLGVLAGFREKLRRTAPKAAAEAGPARPATQTRALLALAGKELETFVAERYPRLVRRGRGGALRDGTSYHAGVEAGEKINLSKGVTEKTGNRGLLLGS